MRGKVLNLLIVISILLLTTGVDQATKLAARKSLKGTGVHRVLGDFFIVTYVENKGAFLSLGSSWPQPAQKIVFTFLSSAILGVLLVYILRAKGIGRWELAGYAILAGGGISNILDRIFRNGHVTDFMNLGIGPVRTGIFNFADLFIMAGIGILLVMHLRSRGAPVTS